MVGRAHFARLTVAAKRALLAALLAFPGLLADRELEYNRQSCPTSAHPQRSNPCELRSTP